MSKTKRLPVLKNLLVQYAGRENLKYDGCEDYCEYCFEKQGKTEVAS